VRSRRITAFAAVLATVAAMGVATVGTASAVQTPETSLVTADPANYTPNVLDGKVESLVQIGGEIYAAGLFTQVQLPGNNKPILARTNVFAFDAATGVIDPNFDPTFDGEITTLIAAPDGQSVYVGGYFSTVNGVTSRKLVRLNVSDGSITPGFNVPAIDSNIQDMRIVHGQLIIAGDFTTVGGVARGQLASLDAGTGLLTNFVSHTFAGPHNGGDLTVNKIDATPDGNKILALGNWTTIDGQNRDLLVLLDTSGAHSVVSPWQTNFFAPGCSKSFDTYMRDLDISPDGTWAVVTTTGAYGGVTSPCDTETRWDLTTTAQNLKPVWTNVTGGDTTYAVAISGPVVYVGGHFRWANNPYAGDAAGAGAVPRQGIAALDANTGLPLTWNPGRQRGIGVFDLLATSTGLWVGDDTDIIGGETHKSLAYFPLAGGSPMPANSAGTVPNDIYTLGNPNISNDQSVLYRVDAAGPAIPTQDDGPDWMADQTDPSPYRNSGSSIATYTGTVTSDGTIPNSPTDRAPLSMFNSERWDGGSAGDGNEMQWHFAVPVGTHVAVRLYMSNRCTCTQFPGQRKFGVTIDGTTVASNIDLSASPGSQKATMKTFNVTSDGSVDITFLHQVENPLVNGIEILNLDAPTGTGSLGAADSVHRQFFAGSAATPTNTTTLTPTEAWSQARGAFLLDGTVYAGEANGTFTARSFDGTNMGTPTSIPLYSSTFLTDLPGITGLAYSQNQIYYTLAGDSNLYTRLFSSQSQVVGAIRNTVTGAISSLNPARVQGMFISGGTLYFADKTDGHLYSIGLTGAGIGSPGTVTGTATLVNSAMDWRARGDLVWNGSAALTPNQLPTAVATSGCTVNVCTFDGSGSVDPDGSIASYAWNFGDGTTGTGVNPSHAYTAAGSYVVTLTVTDNRGGTASTSIPVDSGTPPNQPPVASYTTSCTFLACSLDGSASTDPDGTVASYAWDFGDGSTATGPTASHTFASAGTYNVALTVVDNGGAPTTLTKAVVVVAVPPSNITYVGSASASLNAAVGKVTVPAGVHAGNEMLLFATTNTNTNVTTPPAGWTFVGEQISGTDTRTRLYSKVAGSTDAGTQVSLTYAASTKVDLSLSAYTGVDNANPITAFTSAPETVSRAAHTAPAVTVAAPGSWVVGYWADKSSATTGWTAPAGMTARVQSIGTSTGRITSLEADSGSPVLAGTRPAQTATASAASAKATMWSVVLNPDIPNVLPTASATGGCTANVCTLDGSGSVDPDGTIASYAWTFGDGSNGTGAHPSHAYSAAGPYTATLTVTDNRGGTATATVPVTAGAVPNVPPVASYTTSCTFLACSFDGSGSSDPDGTVASYAWDFGDGATATGATATHSFGIAGTYSVALTVTDNSGAPTTLTKQVTVSAVPASHIAFRAAVTATANSNVAKLTVPASVQAGDAMLLFATTNSNTSVTTDPAGWTFMGEQISGTDTRTRFYSKVAVLGEAGTTVTVPYAVATKIDLSLSAYSGTSSTPVVAFASAAETVSRATHTTPSINVSTGGSWVVSFWADKSSATTTWTPPAGQVQRALSVGSGSGRITSLEADSGAAFAPGVWAGQTATANSASAKATLWTIVLATS
jgi:PKD repeat protein